MFSWIQCRRQGYPDAPGLPAINMGEAALLYCFIFLYLAAAGPGPWSIDRD
jgi:putative oxidoreductase